MNRPCECLSCAALLVLTTCEPREAWRSTVGGGEVGSPVQWTATDAAVRLEIGHLLRPETRTIAGVGNHWCPRPK